MLIGGIFAIGAFALNNLGSGTGSTATVVASSCGATVETLVDGFKMLPEPGKIGHEQHLNTEGSHYCDAVSQKATGGCTQIGGGAFYPRDTDQERWYFNTQWGGYNWEPTRHKKAPTLDNSKGAAEARKALPHAKLIVTSNETGKSIVVSAEESGPALWVTDKHGINSGGPPEVYVYIEASNPYTGSPKDGKGAVTVGFAKDQSIKLGPCK